MAYPDAQADYSHEFFDDADAYAERDDDGGVGGGRLALLALRNLTAANLTSAAPSGDAALPSSVAEAVLLFAVAAFGASLNAAVVASVVLCSRLRRLTNAFIVHGALVDAARCCLCLPYALSALRGEAPADCDTLGTAEVVALSVSMFNLLAMVLTEAYTFHVHNMDEFDTDRRGALLCVLFGVCMVYAAGLIIHLGPTLIGGHFQYAKGVGSCSFRDYVLQAIWVAIVSLTVTLIFVYVVKFYKQLKANDDFRLRVLGRTVAAYSRGLGGGAAAAAAATTAAAANPRYFNVIRALQRRIKVLATIGASYIVCYYPFFFLTLIDRHLEQPKVYYKILTYLSWSQAAIAPLVFIACDGSLGLVCSIRRCCASCRGGGGDDGEGSSSGAGTPKALRENSRQPLVALTRDSSYAVSFADKLGQRSNGGGGGSGGGCWRDRGAAASHAYVYAWPPPPNGLAAAGEDGDDDGDVNDGDAEAGLATATWIERHPAAAAAASVSQRLDDSDETAI